MAKTFRVKLTRNVGIRGESRAAGDVVELSEGDAAVIVPSKGYLLDGSEKPVSSGELSVKSGKKNSA